VAQAQAAAVTPAADSTPGPASLESAATAAVTAVQQDGADQGAAAEAAAGMVLLPMSLADRVARLQTAQQALRERVLQVSDGLDRVRFMLAVLLFVLLCPGRHKQGWEQAQVESEWGPWARGHELSLHLSFSGRARGGSSSPAGPVVDSK
jgi:hypothetical protein